MTMMVICRHGLYDLCLEARNQNMIHIITKHTKFPSLDAAVFDFDGTLSKLRAGWENVMAPLMCESIPGDPAEVAALVEKYIDQSTGIQTIHQMRWLAEEVNRRGGKAEDPWTYKEEYNRRLMLEVQRRRNAVMAGTEDVEKYSVPGSMAFLTALKERGVELYAASGTDEEDVRAEAEVLGFAAFFREIGGARRDTDDCSKEAVLRRLVKPGRNLLVVGDGKVEIALGREAGALTLGIASQDDPGNTLTEMNEQKYRRLAAAGAHAIVCDFRKTEELLAWI
jgi:phosphoglycolate phosphatase-like HAD superfamily hydrolase